MPTNSAYQVESYNDIEATSGLTIGSFCAAFPQYWQQLGTDSLPNLCIATGGGQPPMNFISSSNNEPYELFHVEYDAEGNPPHRITEKPVTE